MGRTYIYKCTNCNYKVETSGKLDSGMVAVVEPHICNNCNELTDVLVGEYGCKIEEKNITDSDERKFYRCRKCKSKNILHWDIKKRPCPKCKGIMEKDNHGAITLWD